MQMGLLSPYILRFERMVSIVALLHIRLISARTNQHDRRFRYCTSSRRYLDTFHGQLPPDPARLHFPIHLHRPLSRDGVNHREVSQLALEKRTLVDVLVTVDVRARIAVSPTGDGYGLPHHLDVAPEFAFDLVPDFAELVGAGSAWRCVCVRKVPRRAGWGIESEGRATSDEGGRRDVRGEPIHRSHGVASPSRLQARVERFKFQDETNDEKKNIKEEMTHPPDS
jgi:hypothetical protein